MTDGQGRHILLSPKSTEGGTGVWLSCRCRRSMHDARSPGFQAQQGIKGDTPVLSAAMWYLKHLFFLLMF